jgi:hypothetical protein
LHRFFEGGIYFATVTLPDDSYGDLVNSQPTKLITFKRRGTLYLGVVKKALFRRARISY